MSLPCPPTTRWEGNICHWAEVLHRQRNIAFLHLPSRVPRKGHSYCCCPHQFKTHVRPEAATQERPPNLRATCSRHDCNLSEQTVASSQVLSCGLLLVVLREAGSWCWRGARGGRGEAGRWDNHHDDPSGWEVIRSHYQGLHLIVGVLVDASL